jgi:hypothetical protein
MLVILDIIFVDFRGRVNRIFRYTNFILKKMWPSTVPISSRESRARSCTYDSVLMLMTSVAMEMANHWSEI